MRGRLPWAALLGLLAGPALAEPTLAELAQTDPVRSGAAGQPVVSLRHAMGGAVARLELRPAPGEALEAGQALLLRLELADEDGRPLRGLRPAAWAERGGGGIACRDRVRGLLENRLGRRAEVNFNAWHLAYLGDNGAVQVLDPVGGTSRTRLLAALALGGEAGGWAADAAGNRIFASVPSLGEVVEIDTLRWVVARHIPVGGRPARLALDAATQRLWVGQDGEAGATAEVALLGLDTGTVLARLPVGPGPHALAALGPGRALAAGTDGAVSLGAEGASPLPGLGGGFTEAAHSALAQLSLLLNAAAGRVLALDAAGQPVGLWNVAPGAAGLFPDPTGRLLFIPEPGEDRVTVIDLARRAVAHRVPVPGGPLRLGFSGTQAYVQSREGSSVTLIALGSLEEGGTPALTGIAAGSGALEGGAALGPLVVAAPGQEGMLIAEPEQRVVHVYMEGMAAPSGLLRAPRGRPLALAAIDHALRETAPGRYETRAVFPGPGRYILPVMLQGGDFLHCFEADLGEDRALPLARRLTVAPPESGDTLPAGTPSALRLRLSGPEDSPAWRSAPDASVLLTQLSGHWQERLPLRPVGDGRYEAEGVTPPRPGLLRLHLVAPSLGLEAGTLPPLMLRAVSP